MNAFYAVGLKVRARVLFFHLATWSLDTHVPTVYWLSYLGTLCCDLCLQHE